MKAARNEGGVAFRTEAMGNKPGFALRATPQVMACRAEVRVQIVRLRPEGYGATAFIRLANEGWWAVTGSNRRHLRCKRSALPAELTARRAAYSSATAGVAKKFS